MRNRSLIPVIAFTLPFTGSILFAYAWFNTDIGRGLQTKDQRLKTKDSEVLGPWSLVSGPPICLSPRTNIPGYTFVPDPVDASVMKTLGTTNILSGTFVRNHKTKDQRPKTKDSEVLGPWSLVSGPSSSSVPGPSPIPEPVSVSVMKTVGTTNILNGTFVRNAEETKDQRPKTKDSEVLGPWSLVSDPQSLVSGLHRVTVFLATWPVGNKRGVEAMFHTPDGCWSASGWRAGRIDEQQSVEVEIPCMETSKPNRTDLFSLRLNCRLFSWSKTGKEELAIWGRTVGGRSSLEGAPAAVSRQFWVRLKDFFATTEARSPPRAISQFVRYSIPVDGDLPFAIEQIRSFGSNWLILDARQTDRKTR